MAVIRSTEPVRPTYTTKTGTVVSVNFNSCYVLCSGSATPVMASIPSHMLVSVGDTVVIYFDGTQYIVQSVYASTEVEAEPAPTYEEATPEEEPEGVVLSGIETHTHGIDDIVDYPANAENIQDIPVSLATPTDGQVLKYNGTNGEWEPGDAPGGSATSIQGVDVDATAPTDGQALIYDDSDAKWKPQTPSSGAALTGEIKMYAARSVPSGWLKCNGDGVSRTTYADLFALLGLIHSQKLCTTAIDNLANLTGNPISGGDNASYPKGNAFDGSTSTEWRSSQVYTAISGAAYIGKNFYQAKKIRRITVTNVAAASYCPSSVLVQRSNDGTSWTTVLTKTMTTTSGSTTTIDIPEVDVVAAQYWRLLANANLASGYAWRVAEIGFYNSAITVHCPSHGFSAGAWITLDDIDATGIEVYSSTGTALTFSETDQFRVAVIDADNFYLDNGNNFVYYRFYIPTTADIRAYDKDTFPVPDMRGEFIRGYDDGRTVDSGRKFGVAQAEQIGYHRHTYTTKTSQTNTAQDGSGAPEYVWGSANSGYAGGTENNNENRPRNVVVNFIIKT